MKEVLRDLRAEILSLKVRLGDDDTYGFTDRERLVNAKIEALEWAYNLIQKKGMTL